MGEQLCDVVKFALRFSLFASRPWDSEEAAKVLLRILGIAAQYFSTDFRRQREQTLDLSNSHTCYRHTNIFHLVSCKTQRTSEMHNSFVYFPCLTSGLLN